MNGAFWALLKALFTILPIIILAIRDGQIKDGTEKEIRDALNKANDARVKRAVDARDGPDDGLSDGFDRDAP